MKNLSFLNGSKEELVVAEDLLQMINFSSNKNSVSLFLSEVEQIILKKIIDYNYTNVDIYFYGGFSSSERKKAKLIINNNYDIDYGIVCLHAKYNNRFSEIRHRDVMGAIYNFGIHNNRIGDIVVDENNIYIFVDKSISDYIIMNFKKIKNINLNFESISEERINIEKKYEDCIITSSSFRLDSIVSKITNKSRTNVKEMISKEFIKLNHIVIINPEKIVKQDDLISIRKYGRFIIDEYSQNERSKKYRIKVRKVI